MEVGDLLKARNVLLVRWSDFTDWVVDSVKDPKAQAGLEEAQTKVKENEDRYLLAAITKLELLYFDWLPLVYGLLGAMAFLLRSLARNARERLYRIEDTVANVAHLCLGAFAGLAIGWFWKGSGGSDNEMALSPFAVAFVAGYSIDLVFTLMDRIVNTFSGRPEQTDKPK